MASIRKELSLDASAENVWSAVRDFAAVHRRVAPGFAVEAKMDGDARIVTFANGNIARERLVTLDDDARRLVYAVVSERVTHYNASVQVLSDGGGRCRLVWMIDFLPDQLAGYIGAQMADAVRVMKPALERA